MKIDKKLTVESKLYILDFSKLEVGDVILTRDDQLQSRIIQSVTDGEFSHALLYVEHGSCIHANGSGVHSLNVQRLLFENSLDVMVLRLKPGNDVGSSVYKMVCDYVREKVGVRYDKVNAIKAGLVRHSPAIKPTIDSKLKFCSQLVFEAFANQGIIITPRGRFCTPADIADSPVLEEVADAVVLATLAEKNFALDESRDKVKVQTQATNFIFNNVRRKVDRNVNTFEELYGCAINDRRADLKISKIIKDSKYLDMAKLELRDCAWRYDLEAFERLMLSAEERLSLIDDEINDAIRQVRKYEGAVRNYGELYAAHGSLTLKCVLGAYREMLTISRTRYDMFLFLKLSGNVKV